MQAVAYTVRKGEADKKVALISNDKIIKEDGVDESRFTEFYPVMTYVEGKFQA
ncbi:hypothetical protein GCM10007086_45470 [Photobacterium aphoticum]|nr:hypothetical protein GCM10007086_45470 [Photobacterium aphoticum]